MSELFEINEKFPPYESRERIDRYRKNRKVFKGQHFEVFKNYDGSKINTQRLYIAANLASIICKKSADFLFGEAMQVKSSTGQQSEEQKAFDKFVEDNHLNILAYENALSNAYRGDSFIKVRWGQEYGGILSPEQDPFKVIIENVSAENVFPETSDFDQNKIIGYHIAIPVGDDVGEADERWTLFVESHYAGRIEYRSFDISPSEHTNYGKNSEIVSFLINSENTADFTVVNTGIPIPLVVHVPNTGTDDCWEGIDDLTEHMSIFEEINSRLTQIASILDNHAEPPMAVPVGVVDEDEAGNPVFNARINKVFEIMGKEDIVPSYITWDGQLESAFTELDKLIELLLVVAEIPPVVIGKGDSAGTSGTSSLAIKFRFSSMLAKINRKRQYYEKAFQQVFKIAQLLDTVVGTGAYAISKPQLIFSDGLPEDPSELATIANIRTGGMKTQSQKSAIMEMNNCTEAQADLEIEQILKETERDMPEPVASPDIFQSGKPASNTEKHANPKKVTDKVTKGQGKTGAKKA